MPWQYISREGLLHFLSARIDEGFAVPLNPKWAVCDEGWWALHEKMLGSPQARAACDAWLPPSSGLRERMAALHASYPGGFVRLPGSVGHTADDFMSAEVAEWKLKRYLILQRAKRKLRAVSVMLRIFRSRHARRSMKRIVNAERVMRRMETMSHTRSLYEDNQGGDETDVFDPD